MQRLVKEMPDVEFYFLFDRQWDEQFIYASNVKPVKLSPQARHPFLWYCWFEYSVKKWLKNNPMDLFLSLDSFLSLKTNTPTFLVMHDLAFEHFPQHTSFWVERYYKHFFPKYAQKAKHIFAVSHFTKQDIVKQYQIKENKISIAHCGVSAVYQPLGKEQQQIIKKQLTNGKPYFICIGSLNPRKNISQAIKAFNLFKQENPQNQHQLVIVGAKGWKTSKLFDTLSQSPFRSEIQLTGHLEPNVLSQYLASAEALIFPSLFEGFGIPIVEAYSCQVPVITSNISSTQEIGKEATLLIDPQSAEEIKNAMQTLVQNSTKREECIAKGVEKLKQYSWQKSAESIAQKIRSILV